MYNEFGIKHYKGKWPCTAKTLYSEKTLIGRLQQYFFDLFWNFFCSDSRYLISADIIHIDLRIRTFHLVSVSAFFIRNNGEITECILLCMFLCKGWLFQIYEYYCQDCFEADTGFIADTACISVRGWYDGI